MYKTHNFYRETYSFVYMKLIILNEKLIKTSVLPSENTIYLYKK